MAAMREFAVYFFASASS
jgi:hypothetical protein